MNEDGGSGTHHTPVEVLQAAMLDLGLRRWPRQAEPTRSAAPVDSPEDDQASALELVPPGDRGEWTSVHPLPQEIRELYAYAGGFSLYGEMYLWDPSEGTQVLTGVFDDAVGLWQDGFGNGTAVDIRPETGALGAVLHLCHDPAMIVVEAPDLSGWLQLLFDQCRKLPLTGMDEDSLVEEASELTFARLEPRRERTLGPANALSPGDDAVLGAFLGRLPPGAVVFDLRELQQGDYVDLMPYEPDIKYQRAGDALLFAALT